MSRGLGNNCTAAGGSANACNMPVSSLNHGWRRGGAEHPAHTFSLASHAVKQRLPRHHWDTMSTECAA